MVAAPLSGTSLVLEPQTKAQLFLPLSPGVWESIKEGGGGSPSPASSAVSKQPQPCLLNLIKDYKSCM